VALWNSNTSQPGGLEFEVMDMVYQLPFRDWMELDKAAAAPAAPAPEAAEDSVETIADGANGSPARAAAGR
jgi:beta-lactamase class C